jgi:hypothetical protein
MIFSSHEDSYVSRQVRLLYLTLADGAKSHEPKDPRRWRDLHSQHLSLGFLLPDDLDLLNTRLGTLVGLKGEKLGDRLTVIGQELNAPGTLQGCIGQPDLIGPCFICLDDGGGRRAIAVPDNDRYTCQRLSLGIPYLAKETGPLRAGPGPCTLKVEERHVGGVLVGSLVGPGVNVGARVAVAPTSITAVGSFSPLKAGSPWVTSRIVITTITAINTRAIIT